MTYDPRSSRLQTVHQREISLAPDHRRLPQHQSQRQGDSRGDDKQRHEAAVLGPARLELQIPNPASRDSLEGS